MSFEEGFTILFFYILESDHSRSGSNIRRGRKRVEKDGDSQSLSSFRRRREGDGQSSSISRVALKHLSTNLSASREAGGSRTREAGGSRSYRLGGNSNIDASSYSRFRELSSNPVYDEDNSGISHVSALEPLAPLDAIFEEKGVGTPSGARATGGGYFQARGAIPVSEAIAVGDSVQLPPETSLPTTSSSNVAPKPKSTFKKRMPSLAISVEAEDNYDNVADDMVAFLKNQSTVITKLSPHSVSDCSESISPSDKFEASNSGVPNASRAAVGAGGHSSNRKQCSSSSDSIVRVGDFKIRETGLSMSTGDDNSYRLGGNSITRRPRYGATQRSAFVSLGGSFNFIEINALGQGASGAVVEALHVPTLTIVALKMLPSYNQQKRANIESELAVLCKWGYLTMSFVFSFCAQRSHAFLCI